MKIGEEIQQKKFKSEHSKAIINILYTCSWIEQKHNEVFKPKGLTLPQYNVLRILRGQFPTPATVNLIIERMMDKSSNASRIVDRLENKELVVRRRCQNDGRAVDVLISQKGLDLLVELDDELEVLEKDIFRLEKAEANQLNFLLDKIRS